MEDDKTRFIDLCICVCVTEQSGKTEKNTVNGQREYIDMILNISEKYNDSMQKSSVL